MAARRLRHSSNKGGQMITYTTKKDGQSWRCEISRDNVKSKFHIYQDSKPTFNEFLNQIMISEVGSLDAFKVIMFFTTDEIRAFRDDSTALDHLLIKRIDCRQRQAQGV